MKDALCVTVIATGFADRPTIGLADGNGGGRRRAAPGQAAPGQAETVSGTAAS
jgi:hypothetical protein